MVRNVEIPYSEFKAKLAAGELADVTVGPVIEGLAKGAAHVVYWAARPPNPIGTLIMNWLFPLLVLATLWSLASRNLAGRVGGGIFGAGKSKATEVKASDVGVTFKDVGGADEAIGELQEIIQFLQTPQRFARLGGRIPNGVLLVGPPGTGKMLIAKATTGEAGVRFFETSGSEFVEMFVGVGAARVYAICSRRPGRPRRRSNVWSADSSSAAA